MMSASNVETERQIDRKTDRQIDKHNDIIKILPPYERSFVISGSCNVEIDSEKYINTDRQKDRKTERQRDRQKDRQIP
jgi:hypothetical protein